MWSSRLLRNGLLVLAILGAPALAGCSGLRPVYGGNGVVTERLELAYEKPRSRLEQIIIEDLALRLGKAAANDAPAVTLVAGATTRALTRTAVTKPATQHEVTVTATYSVADGDGVLASGTRRATASYVTVGQVLADEAAYKDALERAGHAVAETVRLSILAELAAPVREADRRP